MPPSPTAIFETYCHSRAMRKHRTTVRNCAPENLEIPRCAIAHLRFVASRRPGMTEEVGFRGERDRPGTRRVAESGIYISPIFLAKFGYFSYASPDWRRPGACI